MRIKQEIERSVSEFIDLCKMHNVKKLYAFGSSVTDSFDEQTSDIDFVVEIEDNDPISRGEHLMSLWDKFEVFFRRKVDLLTATSIKNPVLRKSIENSKVIVYDGTKQEILI